MRGRRGEEKIAKSERRRQKRQRRRRRWKVGFIGWAKRGQHKSY